MTTDEVTDHPMSASDVTVLSLLLQQMTVMEQRIVHRMDLQAEAAKNRWQSHDAAHDEWERALKALNHKLDDHLRAEERDKLIFDARLGPAKRAGLWVIKEWRTLAILALLGIDFVIAAGNGISKVFGG